MKKGNKFRLVFWGLIWLCVLGAGSIGIYSYYTGHGKAGKIYYELKPVVKSFNSLKSLDIYKNADINITAKIDGSSILVIYNTGTSIEEYTFLYQDGDKKLLSFDFDTSNNTISTIIAQLMVEAVSEKNGYTEKNMFTKYKLEEFGNSIDEGLYVKSNNNVVSMLIDINKSILENKKSTPISDYRTDFYNKLTQLLNDINNEYILSSNGEYTYSNATNCNLSNSPTDLKYTIKYGNQNNIISAYIANNNYQFYLQNVDINNILIESITDYNPSDELNEFVPCN